MHNIDVHLITMDEPDRKRLISRQEFLDSLEEHPINVHHIAGIKDDIMSGRIAGFTVGSAEYVSFVDDDDIIHPGVFERCHSFLKSNPQFGGVYTNSIIEFENKRQQPFFQPHVWSPEWHMETAVPIHQICVFRRDIMESAIAEMQMDEYHFNDTRPEQLIFTYCASMAPIRFLDFIGYTWFKKITSCHQTVITDKMKEVRKELLTIRRTW